MVKYPRSPASTRSARQQVSLAAGGPAPSLPRGKRARALSLLDPWMASGRQRLRCLTSAKKFQSLSPRSHCGRQPRATVAWSENGAIVVSSFSGASWEKTGWTKQTIDSSGNRATSPFWPRQSPLGSLGCGGEGATKFTLHGPLTVGRIGVQRGLSGGGGRPVIPGPKMIRGCLTQDGRAVVGYQLATTWPRGNAAQRNDVFGDWQKWDTACFSCRLFVVWCRRGCVGVLQRHHQGR